MDENEDEIERHLQVEGFNHDDLFTEDELAEAHMAGTNLFGRAFVETQYEVVGFAVEKEVDCDESHGCGNVHKTRVYTANPISWVILYQAAIDNMRENEIMNRAVRLLMLSFPKPEFITEEQAKSLVIGEKIPMRVCQMHAWIGGDKLDMNEVAQFLGEQNGG